MMSFKIGDRVKTTKRVLGIFAELEYSPFIMAEEGDIGTVTHYRFDIQDGHPFVVEFDNGESVIYFDSPESSEILAPLFKYISLDNHLVQL